MNSAAAYTFCRPICVCALWHAWECFHSPRHEQSECERKKVSGHKSNGLTYITHTHIHTYMRSQWGGRSGKPEKATHTKWKTGHANRKSIGSLSLSLSVIFLYCCCVCFFCVCLNFPIHFLTLLLVFPFQLFSATSINIDLHGLRWRIVE